METLEEIQPKTLDGTRRGINQKTNVSLDDEKRRGKQIISSYFLKYVFNLLIN